MNCKILVLCELHWAVERPELSIYFNGDLVEHSLGVIEKTPALEKVSLESSIQLQNENRLELVLSGKTPRLITEESDHWVDVKNIIIDDIAADWLMTKTTFRHSLPEAELRELASQGYIIEPEYQPGCHMRLNGRMSFEWPEPFWLYRTIETWKA